MASTTEDFHGSMSSLQGGGGAPLGRQTSSTSCGSQASQPASLSVSKGNTPYISIMKHNLNFFMTRLLFMEEDKADSLQARRSKVGNNSSGSLAFNDSRAMNDSQQGLLGGHDSWDHEQEEGVIVFQDNARILPNSVAKSMPPVPFPPAAPESPRPVEGKDGISFITPRHKRLESLPEALPLDDLSVGDDDEDDDEEEEDDLEASQELLPPPDDMDTDSADEHQHAHPQLQQNNNNNNSKSREISKTQPKRKSGTFKAPTPFVPPEQRVFPKNQPRRLRNPSNPDIRRSQSSRQMKEAKKSRDELEKGHSCHSLH